MSKSNAELAKRVDVRLGNLVADGGLLNPEQSNEFIDLITDEPTILSQVRQVRMNAPQRKINRLGFESRVLKAARQDPNSTQEGTATGRSLTQAERSKPVSSQIQLNTKEVIAEVRIPYEVLEDNVEKDNFEQHVMRQLAVRVAQDLEELALNGDTASGDAYLALTDGFLKKMTSNVINNAAGGVSPDLFATGMLSMPQRYMRNLNNLKHFISTQNMIKYRQKVAERATGYGDSVLTGNQPIYVHGVQVEGAPMLAAATESAFGAGDGSSKESGIFTFPQNLLFGIQRQVTVETDRDIKAREHIIVVTARVDFQIDDEAACVKYTNIGA
jgi:hypothetical protein